MTSSCEYGYGHFHLHILKAHWSTEQKRVLYEILELKTNNHNAKKRLNVWGKNGLL